MWEEADKRINDLLLLYRRWRTGDSKQTGWKDCGCSHRKRCMWEVKCQGSSHSTHLQVTLRECFILHPQIQTVACALFKKKTKKPVKTDLVRFTCLLNVELRSVPRNVSKEQVWRIASNVKNWGGRDRQTPWNSLARHTSQTSSPQATKRNKMTASGKDHPRLSLGLYSCVHLSPQHVVKIC